MTAKSSEPINHVSLVAVIALAGAVAFYYFTLKSEDACARLAEAQLEYQVRHVKAATDYLEHQEDIILAANVATEIRGQYKNDMRLAYRATEIANKGALSAIKHRIDRLTAETANYSCD